MMTGTEASTTYRTRDGRNVPAVTEEQMREVDRIAVEEFGLGILQMMENAGRSLAQQAMEMLGGERGVITVLAGSGGNGGGGLCCARHLHNRGLQVHVVLSKAPEDLAGAAANQLRILSTAGVDPVRPQRARDALRGALLAVDALIGYSLRGAPRGRLAELIKLCNEEASRVLSLDLPSGVDATTGETPGSAIKAERTLTLALPKTGLGHKAGELYLADIGIPPEVYQRLGLTFDWPSEPRYWMALESVST